jgi:hypothetical protein
MGCRGTTVRGGEEVDDNLGGKAFIIVKSFISFPTFSQATSFGVTCSILMYLQDL